MISLTEYSIVHVNRSKLGRLRATKLRYRYTWRMRGIYVEIIGLLHSEVYVYKRGSNVPLYDITERCCHVYTRRLH